MKRAAALLVVVVSLVTAGSALGSEQHPTLEELETEVICPTCHTLLALSSSPVANQIRDFIRARIAAGDTRSEIKDALVVEFGEGVLAAPPKRGFNLLAWLLPLVGIAVAATTVGVLARRWARSGRQEQRGRLAAGPAPPLDESVERRLDEELARFDD